MLVGSRISLDTLISASTFFVGQWTPALKLNQSRDVLRLVLSKLYGASQGSLFHARMRCSHAALAASCDLSREWTCVLIGRLRQAGWIETSAPRLPDGRQEVTTFRPGRMLRRLLVMLLRSRQRQNGSRVNDRQQKLPTKEEVEKNLHFLRELQETLARKLAPPGGQRGR
jgi:hypothetical protein